MKTVKAATVARGHREALKYHNLSSTLTENRPRFQQQLESCFKEFFTRFSVESAQKFSVTQMFPVIQKESSEGFSKIFHLRSAPPYEHTHSANRIPHVLLAVADVIVTPQREQSSRKELT